MNPWTLTTRGDPGARRLADRHYNRQKPGTVQFVPPGRCVVLKTQGAVWVTSWPYAEYVQHAWAGAWVNSLFRNESSQRASDLIRWAVAATLAHWPVPPALGLISFVDPTRVPATMRHGRPIYGYCFLKAGFDHVGYTQGGLWTWRLPIVRMPPPDFRPSSPLLEAIEMSEGA